MNDQELDELYRRASGQDPLRPSEATRQAILAAALRAADEARTATPALAPTPRYRHRWWSAAGALLAAGIAGLVLRPLLQTAPEPELPSSAPTAPAESGSPPASPLPPAALAPPPPPPAPARDENAPVARSAAPPVAPRAVGAPAVVPPSALGARAKAIDAVTAARSTAARVAEDDAGAALRAAAAAGDLTRLATELDQGAAIDSRDAEGRTALMLATQGARLDAVTMLLARGADPNAAATNGRTPLQVAESIHADAVATALRKAGGH